MFFTQQSHTVQRIRLDNVSVMSSILAFLTDLKEFELHTIYFGASQQIKPLQPVGQAAEFKFESKLKPLQVIWQSLPKAIPFFFMWNENFYGIGKKLLLTKAAPITSLNLLIIHWSLSKNMKLEQNSMFQIESCAKQQI